MRRTLESLSARKRAFAALPFFQRLEGTGSMANVRAFAPGLTFFAMAFQDVLRLVEATIRDPELGAIARKHRIEDEGHDDWFLHDLAALGIQVDTARLFGSAYAQTRDTVYALVAEVILAKSDLHRTLVVLLLEATGEVFFSRVHGFIERAGYRAPLKYFSRRHETVERGHAIFEESVQRRWDRWVFSDDERREAEAVLDRGFAAMTAMVESLEAHAKAGARSGAHVVGRAHP